MQPLRFSAKNFIKDPIGVKAFVAANIKELKDAATLTYTVKPAYAARWDLVSQDLYGNPHLKWVLIYVNDIFDAADLVEGTIINYVSYQTIISKMTQTQTG